VERSRRSSEREALEALHDEQGEAVYRYLLGTLGRREDAEDALQTVWYDLARNISRLVRMDDPVAYLWATVRNRARSVWRSRGRRGGRAVDAEDLDLFPAAENPGADRDELRDLRRAMAGLPWKQREVALLVGVEGCTIQEAGRRLGIPQGTAAGRYRAALKNLKKLLGEEER